MIKNLRRKFIIVSMCSMFVVLLAIMAGLNGINYYRMIDKADRITDMLADNGGQFSDGFFDSIKDGKDNNPPEKTGEPIAFRSGDMSPETPFETRYFTVTLDEDGEYISSQLSNIAAISEENAKEYAADVYEKSSERGFQGIYRYRIVENDVDALIIFVDCRQEISACNNTLVTSLTISGLGLLAVFILVMIFSKMVFKPVAASYEKQRQFITDAGHEIKTPLTIIDANTEVIEMESGENQWTRSTRNQIKRLTDLTQQLITLAKMEERHSKMETIEFCLSDSVADSIEPFYVLAERGQKTIQVNIQENIYFCGDEKSIRQLVGILMDNGVKYSPENSQIKVSLMRTGKKIHFSVFNQAENVVKGNLDILFERFYRTDASRNSETGGSGIGLSVAKAIVTAHKGKITAQSLDGKSLEITIIL